MLRYWKIISLLAFSMAFFYIFETPSMFEPAFAEGLTSSETETDSESQDSKVKDKTSKTYSDILWEYRWYLAGVLLVSAGITFFLGGDVPPMPPAPRIPIVPPGVRGFGLTPHVSGQLITDLIAIRPDVHYDPLISAQIPARLTLIYCIPLVLSSRIVILCVVFATKASPIKFI